MIRHLYILCLLLLGISLPLSASNHPLSAKPAPLPVKPALPAVTSVTVAPTAKGNQKAESKPLASTTPAVSKSSDQTSKGMPTQAARRSIANSSSTNPPKGASRGSDSDCPPHTCQRLARVTAYWAGEGDYYTRKCMSATGVRLHNGHCAVDPNIIPYGSVVEIAGVGKYLAVDTGSAVISRTAAREGGHTSAERSAIVVDLYFEDRREGEHFAASASKFVSITWWTPDSKAAGARTARGLFADENWTKIQSKQL